jgi:hypothetical protein
MLSVDLTFLAEDDSRTDTNDGCLGRDLFVLPFDGIIAKSSHGIIAKSSLR